MSDELEHRLKALEEQRSCLTESQIDHIADKAAKKALQTVYADVGQSVLKRVAWLIGILVISGMLFLAGKDAILK